MANDTNRPDVAVFIDFENVYVSVRDKLDVNPNFESIMDRIADFGRVVIARAYADWYRYPRVTSALYANRIEPMYVPTHVYDRDVGRVGRPIKNSADMNLCVDAMKVLFTYPNISKYVLATGDRDFLPLVNTIRQQGKEVIIIGVGGASSSHLAQAADEFIFYEAIIGKKPQAALIADKPSTRVPDRLRDDSDSYDEEPPRRTRDRERERERPPLPVRTPVVPAPIAPEPVVPIAASISDSPVINGANGAIPANGTSATNGDEIYDVLVQAVGLARERGYVCSFGSLKLLMKELLGGEFRESRYKDAAGRPFAKFKDFVMEAERRGKVQVFTNGTVNEVFLPGEDPYKLSQFAQELKEEPQVTEEVQTEARIDGKPLGGRSRRRRRTRSGERNGKDEPLSADDLLEEALAEMLGTPRSQEPSYSVPEADDSVLDGLLAQIHADADISAQAEDGADSAEDDSNGGGLVPSGLPFTDAEIATLLQVVGAIGRPLSFVQIHDALRDARNSNELSRTNEELRSLIKQTINSGLLVRSGKGARIVYHLPHPEDALDQPLQIIDDHDQTSMGGPEPLPVIFDTPFQTPDQDRAEPTVVAESTAPESETPIAAEPPAKPSRRRGRGKSQPEAAPEPAVEAAPEPAVETAAEPAVEAAAKPRRRRGKTTAPEAAADAAPTESTPAPAEPEAAPAAEPAVERKPRARRRKAE